MTGDVTVVVGLGAIAALFAYFAFELKDSESEIMTRVAVGFFFMSLVFVNLVMYTILLIAQNDATVSYLEGSVMNTGLAVVMWVTLGMAALLFISIFLSIVNYGSDAVIEMYKGRKKL